MQGQKTVFVGLSGGVDSAVAALILKRQGYRVVGAFIQGWEPAWLPCTGAADRLSAMQVAAHLGIPFVTYDLAEAYEREVAGRFIAAYAAGKTPNPDVLCNRMIKFGALWQRAKNNGADYIATGHYARIEVKAGKSQLAVSKDPKKDQTYFLWTLTHDDLAHTLFPVGAYTKDEIRSMAKAARLPNALRPDSQGLCFLGHVDMRAFLKRYLPTRAGIIYDTSGAIVGGHDGAWFYTLGQHVPLAEGTRQYVVSKDVEKNELVVSDSASPQSAPGKSTTLRLEDQSWVSGAPPTAPILAQYRYHGPMIPATLQYGAALTCQLAEPVLAAPGQSLVFYTADGSVCLGGGVIG